MNIVDEQKSLIENIYFISGPIIAILGLFIFRQIQIAKNQFIIAKKQLEESQKQLRINSERQAATLSADLTKEFIKEVIPLANKLYDLKVEHKCENFTLDVKEFAREEVLNWDKSTLFLKRPEIIILTELELLNRLDSISIYFTKKIADEEIAHSAMGFSFCNMVEKSYPTLCLLRDRNKPEDHFKDVITLYKWWTGKLRSSEQNFEKNKLSTEISEKLKRLEELNKTSSLKTRIDPIGTK